MAQAKTLSRDILAVVLNERLPQHSKRLAYDRVLFALSFKGGLRACEMAGLKWRDVISVLGDIAAVGQSWRVPAGIAKKGHTRAIPMHQELYDALTAFRGTQTVRERNFDRPVLPAPGSVEGAHSSPDALRKYLATLTRRMGLIGVTSHSGRRTFTTELIRAANNHGCSIRDVQLTVGHHFLSTTEKYIEPSDGVHKLVNSI